MRGGCDRLFLETSDRAAEFRRGLSCDGLALALARQLLLIAIGPRARPLAAGTNAGQTEGFLASLEAAYTQPLTRTTSSELQSNLSSACAVSFTPGGIPCHSFAIVSRAGSRTGFRRLISPTPDAAERARPRSSGRRAD